MLPVARKARLGVNRAQSGFTLLEALVAAVILAIGVVGIVSLLTLSKVYQHESIQRVRAVELAAGILERMRRNPANVTAYNTGLLTPLTITAGEVDPDCSASSCDAAALAEYDLWDWKRLLDGGSATVTSGGETSNTVGLRNARACIDFTADSGRTNTGIVDVVIQWQGIRETSDAVADGGVACGEAGEEDTTWRQVVVSSYVIDEAEL